jgi:formylglycine-generating enzyme required for sulfatase activity
VAFCDALNEREREQLGGESYRLPTEAEWEYACRAGSTTRYAFGDDAARLDEYAWHDGNSGGRTHPVGQKQPNAFHLYDMSGNVYEWCWDRYDGAYDRQSPGTEPVDPSQAERRVNRGGGWDYSPRSARAANRFWDAPGIQRHSLGFRVARSRPGP